MFKPRAATIKRIDFTATKDLAKIFRTSLTSTAIRLAEHGPQSAMLICSSIDAVEWFVHGDGTKPLWPKRPSPQTYAHDVLSESEEEASGDVLASAWFDHPIAERYQVHEHSIRAYDGLVLTLLWWRNESMIIKLDEYEEGLAARRSDWR